MPASLLISIIKGSFPKNLYNNIIKNVFLEVVIP